MTEPLALQRTEEFKRAIRQGYDEHSIVDRAAVVKAIEDGRVKPDKELFKQFGLGYKIENSWFQDETIQASYFFFDMGRAIALGEENYLVKNVLNTAHPATHELQRVSKENVDAVISRLTNDLTTRKFKPNVLFAPIEYMTPLALSDRIKFQFEVRRDYITLPEGDRLELLWSSNYVRFNDFVLLEREKFAEWLVKLDSSGHRLKIDIEEKEEHYTVTARTIAAFHEGNPLASAKVAAESLQLKSETVR